MIAIKISGTEQRIFSILKISVFQIICAILGQRTNYNLKRIFTFDSTFKNAWWTKRGRRKGTRGGREEERKEKAKSNGLLCAVNELNFQIMVSHNKVDKN